MRLLTSNTETHVDHFDPRKKNDKIQQYSNLFPADARCNLTKGDRWPTKEEQALGIRFLNCCEEVDYGECIFEEPKTGRLIGTTVAARYHIESLQLNCPELCRFRRERARTAIVVRDAEAAAADKPGQLLPDAASAIERLKKLLENEIPLIPPPPEIDGKIYE